MRHAKARAIEASGRFRGQHAGVAPDASGTPRNSREPEGDPQAAEAEEEGQAPTNRAESASGHVLVRDGPCQKYEREAEGEETLAALANYFSALWAASIANLAEARFDIAGHVRNEQGEPVSGASVRAGGRKVPILTDGDGRYRITSLPEAPVEVFASAQGFQAQSRTVALPGDYDFTLSLDGSESDPTTEDRPRSRRGRGGGA